MKKVIFVAVMFFAVSTVWGAIGDQIIWTGGAGTSDWDTAANWDDVAMGGGPALPDFENWAVIDNGADVVISSGTAAVAHKISLGFLADASLTLDGGSLTLPNGDWLVIGDNVVGQPDIATFNMNSGVLDFTTGQIIVGWAGDAIMNMYGGDVYGMGIAMDPFALGITNELNLYGGTLHLDWIDPKPNGGVVNITEGEIILNGDWVDFINGYVATDQILGYGSASNVSVQLLEVDRELITSITAVPEPTSMLLMGLGSVVFFRRKKA